MSIELVKKVGLGVIALLVVCNTYSIHGVKQHSKKTREGMSGMRARLGEAHRVQRPAVGNWREHTQRGSKGSGEGRGRWKNAQEDTPQPDAE